MANIRISLGARDSIIVWGAMLQVGRSRDRFPVTSLDSVVGIAIGCGLDDRGVGVRVPVESRIFSTPRNPDRLLGPPNLLSNGFRG
jgi:hypothetical protein